MHPVFKVEKKGDQRRAAYLGPDGSVVVIFETSVHGQTVSYAKIAQLDTWVSIHNAASVERSEEEKNLPGHGWLSRIVFHDYQGMATLMAAVELNKGQRVHVSVWFDNGTGHTREKGMICESVSFQINGWGDSLGLHGIESLIGGGFTLQGKGSKSRYPSTMPVQTWESVSASETYGDTRIIARYPLEEKARKEAA